MTVGLYLAVFYERRVVSVEDQVVFVSEASHRIGKAIARAFAERSAQVVITGRDLHSLERAVEEMEKRGSEDFAGGGGKGAASAVFPILDDVTVKANVEALVESVVSRFGRMETLVNVAGVNQRKPAEAITEEDYDRVLEIDLKGGLSVEPKGRTSDDCPRLSDQCCLLEHLSSFGECFAVYDEQVGSWPDDARLGFGMREVWRSRQRLGAWFYSHGSYPKTLGRSGNAGIGMAEHALGMAWRAARFG